MKNSPEIFNELLTISPFLAEMEKVNIFQVPEGYFNGLPVKITDFVLLNYSSTEESINKKNLQQVPSGYFEGLSDSILAKVKAVYPEESKNVDEKFTLLSQLKRINPFSVPEGYFDGLSDKIVSKLPSAKNAYADEEQSQFPILEKLKGINVFKVPEGYFDGMSNSVLKNINTRTSVEAEAEINSLPPTLLKLKDINVFKAPEGYFDSLADSINKKLKVAPAKVILMKRRNLWIRYTAAAIVTGIISIGSFLLINGSFNKNTSDTAQLPDYVKASLKYKTSDDLNAGIANLSDADIIKYLEKNGSIIDNELLTNNTDVSELPADTDYLSNDNALKNYLDKLESGKADKMTP